MTADVEIAFCGDDALNIHSVFSLLLKPAETEMAAASSADGSVSDKLYIIDTGLPAADSLNARPGDTLQFYDIQKVTLAGEAVVASMEQVVDTAVLAEAARAMGNVNSQCAGGCGLFNCSGICKRASPIISNLSNRLITLLCSQVVFTSTSTACGACPSQQPSRLS